MTTPNYQSFKLLEYILNFLIMVTVPSNSINDILAIYILALHPLEDDLISGFPNRIHNFCNSHLLVLASTVFAIHLFTDPYQF